MKRSMVKEQDDNDSFNETNNNFRITTPTNNNTVIQKRPSTPNPININLPKDNIVYQSNQIKNDQISSKIRNSSSLGPDNLMENTGLTNQNKRSTSSQSFHDQSLLVETNGNNENENFDQLSAPMCNHRRTSLPLPLKKHDLNADNYGTYVQEEIRPGVILEGYAVEI